MGGIGRNGACSFFERLFNCRPNQLANPNQQRDYANGCTFAYSNHTTGNRD
jgi:hypothetical protein